MAVKYGYGYDKHPIEILHAEFCKTIAGAKKLQITHVEQNCANTPSFEEKKRAIKFHNHLKTSDPKTFHHTELQCQEMKQEKSPLNQLVLKLNSALHVLFGVSLHLQ
jgi:hypothetical protein